MYARRFTDLMSVPKQGQKATNRRDMKKKTIFIKSSQLKLQCVAVQLLLQVYFAYVPVIIVRGPMVLQ